MADKQKDISSEKPSFDFTKAIRTPWPKKFPDVILHTTVIQRNKNPHYEAAKQGDNESALKLVCEIVSLESINKIKHYLKDEHPIVVPVTAIEKHGSNMIPDAFAVILARELDLPVGSNIVQNNYVNHTRNRSYHRMAFPAAFSGEVLPGRSYLIVDDHVGIGGTLANLKGFIESQGGHVILTTTLTASHQSEFLAPSMDQIQKIKDKHGQELALFWKEEIGHDIETLTRAEAGQLYAAPDVDTIRDRIFAAREKGITKTLSGERTTVSDQRQREFRSSKDEASQKLTSKTPSDNISHSAYKKVDDILKEYIEKKSELSRLTYEKVLNMGTDPEAAKRLAEQSIMLMGEIKKFSQNAIQSSEVTGFIEKMKTSPTPILSIGKHGGFEDIEKRFKATGCLSEEEKKTLIVSMKSDANSLTQTQQLTQGRGGQKR